MITIDNKKVTDITIGNKVVSRIVDQETDEVIFEKTAPQQNEYFYIENTYAGANTVTLTTTSYLSPSSSYYSDTVQYSKDKNTWTTVTFNTSTPTTISLSAGEKVYFRNDNGKWNHYGSGKYVTTFTASQSHNVGGNINSLLNYQNMNGVSLEIYCFLQLFLNDTTLVDAGSLVLPTTTLVRHCYYSMFEGCSSLTTAPALPATTVAQGCYQQMFRDCSYLTTTPQTLPATTLAQSCYQSMFERCSRLTSAPALPAATLANYCYEYMFSGCSRLASAPALQATTLANYCYAYMFANCTSLTTAPELPATTLAEYCYSSMFSGCSSLNSVTVYANNNSAANCTVSWLKNVAASGTFNNRGSAVYPTNSVSGIPSGWTEMGGLFHIKNRYNGSNTITVNVRQNGTPTSGTYATSVDYSKNGSSWTTLDLSSTGTKTISMSSGQTVYFRNSSGHWSWYDNTSNRRYLSFYCNQNFEVGGHVASLVDYTNLNVTIPQGSFHLLFYKSSTEGNMSDKLLSSSKLVLPNPGPKAFVGMFNGCINMTDYPTLPTTITANCFDTMFARCRSLTSAPELPSTSLEFACYRQMFYNCTSLVTSPALPATTLAEQCYQQMFQDCPSLSTITSFSATTLAERCCYGMFQNCTALTTSPALPATTLANYCYYGMFLNCTGLITAPALPATELVDHCYQIMFQNCPSLTSVTVYANDNSATDCTLNWLNGVAASGTVHNLGSATYTADSASGIPTGWTEVYV